MAVLDILDIAYTSPPPELLWGFAIDAPQAQTHCDDQVLLMQGWVLGKESPATTLRITSAHAPDRSLKTTPVSLPRADVARQYPNAQNAETCGFSVFLPLIGLPRALTLDVQVLLQNQTCLPLAQIRLRRQPFRSPYQNKLQPLMISSLGRSGSTWLMHVLATSPSVIVDRQYPYESCASRYWLSCVRNGLSNLLPPFEGEISNDPSDITLRWLTNHVHENRASQAWFHSTYIEKTIVFCQQSIDAFYEQIAEQRRRTRPAQGTRSSPIYFAEKYGPGHHLMPLLYEIYPRVSELILVRDFRDLLCSALAFTKKLGVAGFGLDQAQTDEEAVRATKARAQALLQAWQQRFHTAYLVRYEDVVRDPVPTLQRILCYLQLDDSLDSVQELLQVACETMPALLREYHRTSPDPGRSIGRWKVDFSAPLKSLCREFLQEELEAFGYEL